MKLKDILKKVGGGLIRELVPGGGVLIDAVNEMLPSKHKIPKAATGNQVNDVLWELPLADRAAVLDREFDVDLAEIKESYSTIRAMLESDAKNPHTTRPYIAKGAFHVIAFAVIVTVLLWAYGVGSGDTELVKTVMEGWQFILAIIGPFVTLLWAYFGILRQEHKNKLDAANGQTSPTGLIGALASLIKR